MSYNLLKLSALALITAGLATSCTKDDDNKKNEPETDRLFHVAYAVGPASGNAQTYLQGLSFDEISSGTISFENRGFQVPATRTAFIFSSSDGKYIYALNYGGGSVHKYEAKGGQNYTLIGEANVQPFIGTANPRWTKLDEKTALLHNVTTEKLYDENNNYVRTKSTAWLTRVNLEDMTVGTVSNFEIPYDPAEAAQGIYVFRIDKPFVQNGKVYYGVGKQKYDPVTDGTVTMNYTNAVTLVVDEATLDNPSLISTNVGGAVGATNGYRMPVAHADERGDVYQTTTSSGAIHLLKISNGSYDETYVFNISEKLGIPAQTNGWFYVGNGIGYVPYFNSALGGADSYNWGVARVDIYNKTVTKMELPGNLWLQQYQYGVVYDGKFIMSLSPIGAEGNIYIFDPKSTSPTGYTKGAIIQSTGAENYHIGVY